MQICYNCFRQINNTEICPHCGYNPKDNRKDYPLALPNGTVLAGKYILGRVLGQGGFGITYLAYDYDTKEIVAIKEYFPDTVAIRSNSLNVDSYSGQRQESFDYGKECFLNEAKTLAEFIGNPNIVCVHSYFEENNTAYFAMEYVKGVSLQNYIKNNGGKIGYEAAKTILFPIMDALSAVHSKGIIHRDISPDNIFITDNGVVKLLDFGAARYSMGDRSRSLDVVLKHGFAPKEQYTRRGRQGPYTDVYSFAATFYRAISGRIPPDSIDRLDEDELILPSVLGSDIPAQAEDALLKGLSVQPIDRYQSMNEFKQALLMPSVDYISAINNTYQHTDSQWLNYPPQPIGTVVQQPEQIRPEPEKPDDKGSGKEPVGKSVKPDNKSADNNTKIKEQESVPQIKKNKPHVEKIKKEKVKEKKADKPAEPKVQSKEPEKEQKKVAGKSAESNAKANEHKPAAEKKQIKPSVEKSNREKKKKDAVSEPEKKSKPVSANKKKILVAVSSLCAIVLLIVAIIGVAISSPKGDWEYSISEGTVTIEKYLGDDSDVEIPSEIDGATVTAIGRNAFYECDSLCSVKIPHSVNLIEEWAFYGCDELTVVNLPTNVNIKNYAFLSCEKVKFNYN